jgi:hypothetical protein
MKVLSNKKKPDFRIVGARMPLHITHFFTLHTLATGTTKSDILRPLLENWMEQQQTITSEEDLLQMFIGRIDTQWKVEKRSDPLLLFSVFKGNLEKELRDKGIKEEHIKYIIKEIE